MIGEFSISIMDSNGYRNVANIPFHSLKPMTIEKFAKKIKELIETYLMLGMALGGSALAPKKNISKHGSWKIFYDEGELFKSIEYKMDGKNYAEIFVSANRSQVLDYLQGYQGQGGTSKYPARNIFGVDEHMKVVLQKFLNDINKG